MDDQFIQNWNGRINNSSRALFYSKICSFQFQEYLSIFNCAKHCTAMTRLRVSSHRLQIEAGRWHKPNKIPRENRTCVTCNILEDEYHFILECATYAELRKRYINKYYFNRPNMHKFITLITSKVLKSSTIWVYLFSMLLKREIESCMVDVSMFFGFYYCIFLSKL